jgi:hypothetical protein
MSRPDPKLVLRYINAEFRRKESIKLYREILKTAKMFTWDDENGVSWRDLIHTSARAEFENSKQENDPEILARALVNAQMALTDLQEKFKQRQEFLRAEQDKKDEQLRRDIDLSRINSKYEQ